MIPSDSQEIGLTVAGIAACPNTDEMLSLYVEFVRLATEVERFWQPPPERPGAPPDVRDADFAGKSLLLPDIGGDYLRLLPLIIKAEQAGWAGLAQQPDGHWTVTLTREIRRFRNVTDIDDYWTKRYKPWESRPPALLSRPLPTKPGTRLPAKVPRTSQMTPRSSLFTGTHRPR